MCSSEKSLLTFSFRQHLKNVVNNIAFIGTLSREQVIRTKNRSTDLGAGTCFSQETRLHLREGWKGTPRLWKGPGRSYCL